MICEAQLKTITEIIKGEADNLINHYADEGEICQLAVKRLELAVKLLRDEIGVDKGADV